MDKELLDEFLNWMHRIIQADADLDFDEDELSVMSDDDWIDAFKAFVKQKRGLEDTWDDIRMDDDVDELVDGIFDLEEAVT